MALYDAVTALPFGITLPVTTSVTEVASRLDKALFGLQEMKRSIRLEMVLAAHAVGPMHPQALLLVGPPGTGKTATGEAVAQALGLPFIRISLAGHCDVVALKGSAFAWNSSGIGYFAQALIAARCQNPVVLVDEVDKAGGYSNSSVPNLLAEVLDPAESHRYADLFLQGLNLDLSQVIWVLTANDLSKVPDFVLNRCKVINLRSYNVEEKTTIIKNYFPKQIAASKRLDFTIEVEDEVARRLATEAKSLREAKRMLTEMVALLIEHRKPGGFKHLVVDRWDDSVTPEDDDPQSPIGFRP
jgi:ATP-dependent Lon protease